MKDFKASVSITIQNDGMLSVVHECPVKHMPAMLGAVEMTKIRLTEEINGIYRKPDGSGITSYTKQVTKKEAFDKYIEAGKKIQRRLQAIELSDERARFEILEDHLFHKL